MIDLEKLLQDVPMVKEQCLKDGTVTGPVYEKWIGEAILYVEEKRNSESAFYQRFVSRADVANGLNEEIFDNLVALLEAMQEFDL